MTRPKSDITDKYPRLSALARRTSGVLHRINAAPRWVLWLKASLLVGGLLMGIFYLMPHIKPLMLSRDLVVGTRETPTSFMREKTTDADGKPIILESGFDHDLVEAFAKSMGKSVRFVVAENAEELHRLVERGEVHMAAAWFTKRFVEAPSTRNLTGADDEQTPQGSLLRASAPYAQDSLVLVQPDDVTPLESIKQLHKVEVHALKASGNSLWLSQLERQKIIPQLETHPDWSELDLLKAVSERKIARVIVPRSVFRIGINYYPGIDSSLAVGNIEDIVWTFSKRGGEALVLQANKFLATAEQDGTLRQLRDRYFGAVECLQEADRSVFMARMKTRLPQYLPQFKWAQLASGYDWRLLAALAYQESHWDGSLVSPTGVRGLMMLTGDTADHLGVKNRLDPYESIMGGARYLDMLRDEIPPTVPEPDRTWMAIASYNVGPAQINAARSMAKNQKLNPDSWADIKKTLPLLGQTKSGIKIRGGEAVVTAENVRMYYAILSRSYPATTSFSLTAPTRTYGVSAPKVTSSGSGLR